MRPRRAAAASVVALLLLVGSGATVGEQESTRPRDVGLTERAGRRLAQLDVTVRGPEAVIGQLGREDFELTVMGRPIEEFLVDALCPQEAAATPAERQTATTETDVAESHVAVPRRAPASYLFYFDQHHLMPEGRQAGIDTARALVSRLITGGDRGMIVSSGMETVAFAELTDDPELLLAALDRLENDRTQWDPYPYQEETRVKDVLRALSDSTERAKSLARIYQREERWHTQRALHLFSMTLGRLADVDPPRAVIYFADTMRSNAGAHYLSFFGGSPDSSSDPILAAMSMDSFSAGHAFDRVVREAGALGIRLYTVQARGLVSESMLVTPPGRPARIQPQASGRRLVDAQNSLVGLAAETGGESFLHGVRSTKIAERISSDLSCVYLLSFDPTGLPEDRGLPVVVRVTRPRVKVHARGQIVLQSESERISSRLLSAFANTSTDERDDGLRGVVIPTGFADGKFSALVQLAAPASPVSGANWELGMSLVARGKVREDTAGSLTVSGPGVPVVFESEMNFKPGPYEIVMVARESASGRILSARIVGEWPDPDQASVTLGPIAVLQPAHGLFLRDGEVRTSGALARQSRDALRPDRPTWLVGIICHARSRKESLTVERWLEGEEAVDFPLLVLELGEERCAQFRDLVPEKVMTPGSFGYSVRVTRETEELASSRRDLVVGGGDETLSTLGASN